MQIDWITVAAQIVNFLVLVWLLKRFLYRPIIRAMDDREQKIATRLREAQQRKIEADRAAEAYRAQSEALEREKGHILSRATEEAEDTKRALEQSARQEVEQRRREWLQQIEDEKEEFFRNMRQRSAERVFALARQVLSDLSDAQLEERIAASFARQIENIEPDLRDRLVKACHRADGKITVKAPVALDADAQRRITRAVHKGISEGAEVHYERNGGMTGGIELKIGSQTLAWTFTRYLDELEQELNRDLSEAQVRNERPPA
jgi:F-type H+-transporting ATPase subunit b